MNPQRLTSIQWVDSIAFFANDHSSPNADVPEQLMLFMSHVSTSWRVIFKAEIE
jgi:hypothetical protein